MPTRATRRRGDARESVQSRDRGCLSRRVSLRRLDKNTPLSWGRYQTRHCTEGLDSSSTDIFSKS